MGSFGEEFGAIGSNLGSLASAFGDVVANPSVNPIFQGMAALGAGIVVWKLVSMAAENASSLPMKLMIGTGGLVAVALAAWTAAAGVGMVRQAPSVPGYPPAVVQQQGQPQAVQPQVVRPTYS